MNSEILLRELRGLGVDEKMIEEILENEKFLVENLQLKEVVGEVGGFSLIQFEALDAIKLLSSRNPRAGLVYALGLKKVIDEVLLECVPECVLRVQEELNREVGKSYR